MSGAAFLIAFITVASRVVPQSLYWAVAAIVLAPPCSAAVSIGVERSFGALRRRRSATQHDAGSPVEGQLGMIPERVSATIGGTTGGTLHQVNKTTVYLPDDLKLRIEQVAQREGISEAEVIRRSLTATIVVERPKLRAAIFESTELTSEQVDELLAGFGEHE